MKKLAFLVLFTFVFAVSFAERNIVTVHDPQRRDCSHTRDEIIAVRVRNRS
jgi:hypothetical protein